MDEEFNSSLRRFRRLENHQRKCASDSTAHFQQNVIAKLLTNLDEHGYYGVSSRAMASAVSKTSPPVNTLTQAILQKLFCR